MPTFYLDIENIYGGPMASEERDLDAVMRKYSGLMRVFDPVMGMCLTKVEPRLWHVYAAHLESRGVTTYFWGIPQHRHEAHIVTQEKLLAVMHDLEGSHNRWHGRLIAPIDGCSQGINARSLDDVLMFVRDKLSSRSGETSGPRRPTSDCSTHGVKPDVSSADRIAEALAIVHHARKCMNYNQPVLLGHLLNKIKIALVGVSPTGDGRWIECPGSAGETAGDTRVQRALRLMYNREWHAKRPPPEGSAWLAVRNILEETPHPGVLRIRLRRAIEYCRKQGPDINQPGRKAFAARMLLILEGED